VDAGHEKLRETLERLSAQLDAMRSTHPDVARHLDATVAEAKSLLAVPGGKSKAPPITARLKDTMLQYEASHPNLALALGGLIDALSQMGI
jgi:hypothetical protein